MLAAGIALVAGAHGAAGAGGGDSGAGGDGDGDAGGDCGGDGGDGGDGAGGRWDGAPGDSLASADPRAPAWIARVSASACLLYTSPSPRDSCASRMPSS